MTAPQNSNSNPRVFYGPLSTQPTAANVSQGDFYFATDIGMTMIAKKSAAGVPRWDPVDGISAALGTTVGALTTVLTLTPTVAGAYCLYGEVTAFDAADTAGAWFQDQFGFKTSGGPPPTTVAMIGSTVQAKGQDAAINTTTAVYSNSGANLLLTCTGTALKTIAWGARIRISGLPV